MAGHSKWTQIKRQKLVADVARSRIFARYARLITLESRKVGGNLSAPELAAVISRAKAANMPKDGIERAVAKGMAKDSSNLGRVIYEAYGPGGVALLVEALTDSKNRTTQEVKYLLSKQGIEIAPPGAAGWAFSKSQQGDYAPKEPRVHLVGEDEEWLIRILGALDEHADVQRVFTNALGYENTGD